MTKTTISVVLTAVAASFVACAEPDETQPDVVLDLPTEVEGQGHCAVVEPGTANGGKHCVDIELGRHRSSTSRPGGHSRPPGLCARKP